MDTRLTTLSSYFRQVGDKNENSGKIVLTAENEQILYLFFMRSLGKTTKEQQLFSTLTLLLSIYEVSNIYTETGQRMITSYLVKVLCRELAICRLATTTNNIISTFFKQINKKKVSLKL